MAIKFNFWESFAFATALSALQALVYSSNISAQQKIDIQTAITNIQVVESDFSA